MTDPTPAALRVELERLVVTDLLGPSDPHEQLPGYRSPVREWYLVGMLAPRGTVVDPNRSDGDDLQDGDDGGGLGKDDRPAKVVLFPSSAGFTAAVDPTYAELEVEASWGRYTKVDNPDPTATGALQRLWQRHPAGGSTSIALAEGEITPFAPDPGQPDVLVRGRCRRTPHCWLVTLFLVNEQLPAASATALSSQSDRRPGAGPARSPAARPAPQSVSSRSCGPSLLPPGGRRLGVELVGRPWRASTRTWIPGCAARDGPGADGGS